MFIRKHGVFLILILPFIAGTISQYLRIHEHKENDHWVYYRTAKRMQDKTVSEIYSRKDGAFPFRYSPATLMLFSWMADYSEMTSRKIWLVVQALFILAGLYLLYLILIKINSPTPLNCLTFSFFLFYRYFLDALYCGQIVGMFFFGLTLGLFFWLYGRKNLSNLALFFLSMLKIIPGFLIMINLANEKNWKEIFKIVFYLLIAVLSIHIIYFFWFIWKFGPENISEFIPTFKHWMDIVLADGDYFDGSTSKSQALRGVILRLLGKKEKSEIIWKIIFPISFLALFAFWHKIKNDSIKVKIYSYCLGVLAFVLLMPQSLPYQIFVLLIPLIFIMSEFLANFRKSSGLVLFFVLIFCSLPTSDLIGHGWADFIQYKSLPFLAFVTMGIFLLREILLLGLNPYLD